ncbi:MAG: DUF2721 domain-containing protein [Luteolibacter sp.]
MELTLATPTLLFPASSLLFLAYTNRFLHLSALIRKLHVDFLQGHHPAVQAQIRNLKMRLWLIRWMQAAGVVSLLFCLASMGAFFYEGASQAQTLFGIALLLMGISLLMSLAEVLLSGGALAIFLRDMGEEALRSRNRNDDA